MDYAEVLENLEKNLSTPAAREELERLREAGEIPQKSVRELKEK